MPLAESIFAAVFKVYSTVSGRRFISDLRDAHDKGHIRCVPSYNLIFKVLEKESTSEILKSLILASAPLKAVESEFRFAIRPASRVADSISGTITSGVKSALSDRGSRRTLCAASKQT